MFAYMLNELGLVKLWEFNLIVHFYIRTTFKNTPK